MVNIFIKLSFFHKKDESTGPTALKSDGPYFEIMRQWPGPTINLKAWTYSVFELLLLILPQNPILKLFERTISLWTYVFCVFFFKNPQNVSLENKTIFKDSSSNMGLDARKPVFGGLWTTKAHISLRKCAVWSAPLLFPYWKASYLDLLQARFHYSI